MAEKSYTGLKVQRLTVPAYSVGAFDFNKPAPNYFRVQNRGSGKVYCSTSGYPTERIYDFSISGEKAKLYAQPFAAGRLYVFNPSGSEIEAVCTSFYADFDPLALSLTELEIEMPDNIESNMVVTGFNAPLPAGSNSIGNVKLNSGNNKIGSVAVEKLATLATVAKQSEILNHLSDIVSSLSDLLKDKNKYNDDTTAFSATSKSSDTTICGGGGCVIHVLTNDGTTELNLVLTGTTNAQTFTLKPGETIQDFKFIGSIKVTGTGYSFRALVSYPF